MKSMMEVISDFWNIYGVNNGRTTKPKPTLN
jgi:hypothetical protein